MWIATGFFLFCFDLDVSSHIDIYSLRLVLSKRHCCTQIPRVLVSSQSVSSRDAPAKPQRISSGSSERGRANYCTRTQTSSEVTVGKI